MNKVVFYKFNNAFSIYRKKVVPINLNLRLKYNYYVCSLQNVYSKCIAIKIDMNSSNLVRFVTILSVEN